MVGDDMNTLVIISLIVALIAGLMLIFITNYNKFQWMNIKVKKGEINIQSALEKKYEIILNYFSLLNENVKMDENDYNRINFINNDDIVQFNNDLNNLNTIIDKYLDDNEKVLKKDKIKAINKELNEVNIFLNGCKKYYNNNLIKYNSLCKSFPSIIISKIFKYKEKEFIEEDIKESFKILNEDEEKELS